MHATRRFGLAAVVAVALIAGLAFATPASARKFKMSGNWFIRNGQVFIPLQFAATVMSTTMQPVVHASMGNLTGAFHFPNDVIPGSGGVTAGGSAPASLMLPKHRFVEAVMAAVPLNGVTLAQITTNFGIDAPFQAITLAMNGGPGSFTWCVADPACVAKAPPAKRATDPPQGAAGTQNNGRIIYKKGANRFGGTMQMGLLRGGVNSAIRQPAPAQIQHVFFGGAGSTVRNLAPGKGSADVPATEMVYLAAGFVSQPITYTPGKLIKKAGPKVTVSGMLTPIGMGPLLQTILFTRPTANGCGALMNQPCTMGSMGTKVGQFTSNYGFAHTTGAVFGQQTKGTGGQDFLSFMGYDKRTALGAGNIQTVAGGISYRNTIKNHTPYASLHRVRMSLAAPIPSMSPAGFAAAGVLMLLAVGYALRRRLS